MHSRKVGHRGPYRVRIHENYEETSGLADESLFSLWGAGPVSNNWNSGGSGEGCCFSGIFTTQIKFSRESKSIELAPI